jgi:hypothetical protein
LGAPRLEIMAEMPFRWLKKAGCRVPQGRVVKVRGKWFVWVYLAYWTIVGPDGIRASTSTSFCRKRRVARFLEGQRLVGVRLCPRTGKTVFTFDLGASLIVRRMEARSKDELWLLYEPSGYVLSIRGDGTFDHEPASGIDRRHGVQKRALVQGSGGWGSP